jgi:hypothetical protein
MSDKSSSPEARVREVEFTDKTITDVQTFFGSAEPDVPDELQIDKHGGRATRLRFGPGDSYSIRFDTSYEIVRKESLISLTAFTATQSSGDAPNRPPPGRRGGGGGVGDVKARHG